MLEVGREYEITVHIFDKINHRVIVTELKYYPGVPYTLAKLAICYCTLRFGY